MANSNFLRQNLNQHAIKNSISKGMDKDIDIAIDQLVALLEHDYPEIKFGHRKLMHLTEIIDIISKHNGIPKEQFSQVLESSFIKPDGGFIYFTDEKGNIKIVLVAEVKFQGTNDKRLEEGLKKQAKGNAIERLGKNLIGVRALFKQEKIVPFICFGSGCDFADDSSIRDRVITMNEFFPLNVYHTVKDKHPFEPVSMFFRESNWTIPEMVDHMKKIADESMKYYLS